MACSQTLSKNVVTIGHTGWLHISEVRSISPYYCSLCFFYKCETIVIIQKTKTSPDALFYSITHCCYSWDEMLLHFDYVVHACILVHCIYIFLSSKFPTNANFCTITKQQQKRMKTKHCIYLVCFLADRCKYIDACVPLCKSCNRPNSNFFSHEYF